MSDKPVVLRKKKDDVSIVEAMKLFDSRSDKANKKMTIADSGQL